MNFDFRRNIACYVISHSGADISFTQTPRFYRTIADTTDPTERVRGAFLKKCLTLTPSEKRSLNTLSKGAVYSNLTILVGDRPEFIGYESGYTKENGTRYIWINAWMPPGLDRVSAVISIRRDSSYFESHYEKLKEHKSEIETAFSFDTLNPAAVGGNIVQLRVEKDVDLTQTANRDTVFRWLRENLEKLYWVLRVQDTLGWDTAASTEDFSGDIPF